MNLGLTTPSINQTIDLILNKGASKLYDKYITNKLAEHVYMQNNGSLYNNLTLNFITQPAKNTINAVPMTTVDAAPIDNQAAKHIAIKRQSDGSCNFSPKKTHIGATTKYQTVVRSQRTSIGNQQKIFSEEFQFCDIPIRVKKRRVLTMQTEINNLAHQGPYIERKPQEVQYKRVMTCLNRKRRTFAASQQKQIKFIQIDQETPKSIRQQIELTNNLRKLKKEKKDQESKRIHQIAKLDAYVRAKEIKTRQHFQVLNSKLKSSSRQTFALTNFEANNGDIIINGKPKKSQHHISQLQFKHQHTQALRKVQTKVSQIKGKKKNPFVAKIQKGAKVTNEQFGNNGKRQISSIPFLTLSSGVVLTQRVIEASVEKKRPIQYMTRQQFMAENQLKGFKSHKSLAKSVKTDIQSNINQLAESNVKTSFLQKTLTERKYMKTTVDSQRQLKSSILWRMRDKSQQKKIKISNFEVFNQQIMQSKLVN